VAKRSSTVKYRYNTRTEAESCVQAGSRIQTLGHCTDRSRVRITRLVPYRGVTVTQTESLGRMKCDFLGSLQSLP